MAWNQRAPTLPTAVPLRSPGNPAGDLSIPKKALQLGGEQPSGPLLADPLVPTPPTQQLQEGPGWENASVPPGGPLGCWFMAHRSCL